MVKVEFEDEKANVALPIEIVISKEREKIMFEIETNEETVKVIYDPKFNKFLIAKRLLKEDCPDHFLAYQKREGWIVKPMGDYYYFTRTDPKFEIFGEGTASGIIEYEGEIEHPYP